MVVTVVTKNGISDFFEKFPSFQKMPFWTEKSNCEQEMKTPITYYGGKQRMIKHILPLIPPHKKYVEPFAGGALPYFSGSDSDPEGSAPRTYYGGKQPMLEHIVLRLGGRFNAAKPLL
jgi:hypothetical protein